VAALQAMNYTQHLAQTCGPELRMIQQQTLPVMIGEWSVAYKTPSDTANKEPYPTDPALRAFLLAWFKAESRAYLQSPSRGFMFWNFKTEGHTSPMWDLALGVQGGWIPNDLSIAEFDGACQSSNPSLKSLLPWLSTHPFTPIPTSTTSTLTTSATSTLTTSATSTLTTSATAALSTSASVDGGLSSSATTTGSVNATTYLNKGDGGSHALVASHAALPHSVSLSLFCIASLSSLLFIIFD
jgi:hypothetical protein